ncbi:MAG: winged helix-turn-helix domain-containing protein [Egibacteraceae bacterium]
MSSASFVALAQARRSAIAAQGLTGTRPAGRVDIRHLRRLLRQVKLLQIDAVNVVARAHELALFSRLGPHSPELLADAAYTRRELLEVWAHEASYLPVEHWPWLAYRRRAAAEPGRRVRALLESDPLYLERVRDEVAARGPLTASELGDAGTRSGPWWGWSKGKIAMEHLFATGELAVTGRRNFTRRYDLAERVIPAAVRAERPDPEACYRRLLVLAAEAHGVGTAGDLADYFRLHRPTAGRVVAQLAAEGALERVEVEGWRQPAYRCMGASTPRRIHGCALLSPFDSLIWDRARTERLFGFIYRLEIYVPADRRVHGYYVLPFLLGERLVARVDLKADRAAERLLVRASWAEAGIDAAAVAAALATELQTLASWLALREVEIADCGDLAAALRVQV